MEKKLKAIKTKLQQSQKLTSDTAYIVSLAQDAHICNYMDDVAWQQDIDVTDDDDIGYSYIRVMWLPTDAYTQAQEAYKEACNTYDDNGNVDQDLIDRLASDVPDQDCACDWDNPDSITLI